jgi:hypothetical protein
MRCKPVSSLPPHPGRRRAPTGLLPRCSNPTPSLQPLPWPRYVRHRMVPERSPSPSGAWLRPPFLRLSQATLCPISRRGQYVQERSLDDWTQVIGPSAAGVTQVERDATANVVISPPSRAPGCATAAPTASTPSATAQSSTTKTSPPLGILPPAGHRHLRRRHAGEPVQRHLVPTVSMDR